MVATVEPVRLASRKRQASSNRQWFGGAKALLSAHQELLLPGDQIGDQVNAPVLDLFVGLGEHAEAPIVAQSKVTRGVDPACRLALTGGARGRIEGDPHRRLGVEYGGIIDGFAFCQLGCLAREVPSEGFRVQPGLGGVVLRGRRQAGHRVFQGVGKARERRVEGACGHQGGLQRAIQQVERPGEEPDGICLRLSNRERAGGDEGAELAVVLTVAF